MSTNHFCTTCGGASVDAVCVGCAFVFGYALEHVADLARREPFALATVDAAWSGFVGELGAPAPFDRREYSAGTWEWRGEGVSVAELAFPDGDEDDWPCPERLEPDDEDLVRLGWRLTPGTFVFFERGESRHPGTIAHIDAPRDWRRVVTIEAPTLNLADYLA